MPRKLYPPSVKGGKRLKLQKNQLYTLARAGKLQLRPDQEQDLQEACADYIIGCSFERDAVPGSFARPVYEGLLANLDRTIVSIANILGKDTAQHYEIHVELNDQLENVSAGRTTDRVLQDFMDFQGAVVSARDAHRLFYGGPGRPMKNETLREFIWRLADLFEDAGGRAGVTYGWIDNRLKSPFLSWVNQINSFLPAKLQAKPTALGDLVREVCGVRNKRKRHQPRIRPT